MGELSPRTPILARRLSITPEVIKPLKTQASQKSEAEEV